MKKNVSKPIRIFVIGDGLPVTYRTLTSAKCGHVMFRRTYTSEILEDV